MEKFPTSNLETGEDSIDRELSDEERRQLQAQLRDLGIKLRGE